MVSVCICSDLSVNKISEQWLIFKQLSTTVNFLTSDLQPSNLEHWKNFGEFQIPY